MVTYVDILGFRTLIDRSGRNDKTVGEILQILQLFRRKLGTPGSDRRDPSSSPGKFLSTNFSDLIVRCKVPRDLANVSGYANDEIAFLSRVQTQLAVQGNLIRGGVCVGKIYANDEIFGPALVKAYVLENEYAIYPRIVIDRDLIYQMKGKKAQGEALDEHFVERGEDGAHFIDYLRGQCWKRLTGPLAANEMTASRILGRHREVIESVIHGGSRSIHVRTESLKKKYIWLSLYHNRTVAWLLRNFPKSTEAKLIERERIADRYLRF